MVPYELPLHCEHGSALKELGLAALVRGYSGVKNYDALRAFLHGVSMIII